jgi:hypothetical protein
VVTLDEDEDYLLGNDSDTLFIRDNDTTKVYWVSTSSTSWSVSSNWSTGSVPTSGQDVYFNGSNYANCTNAGTGLSTLAGLHLVNGYNGTVTLANALSVGTYEQTSGTLNQPSARDLTVTDAMLWSGGTLDTTDSGADVIVDGAGTGEAAGAWGRINPPDTGSMSTASTLKVVNDANVTILSGALEFTGGTGLYIAADVKGLVETPNSFELRRNVAQTDIQITITEVGGYRLVKRHENEPSSATSQLPILNEGVLRLDPGIQFTVEGRFGTDGVSISQTSGATSLATGSPLVGKFGVEVTGGNVNILAVNKIAAVIKVAVGKFEFAGNALQFLDEFATTAQLRVEGEMEWTSGLYKPAVDKSDPTKASLWYSIGTFTVGTNATINPTFFGGQPQQNWVWRILEGRKGINGSADARLPVGLQNDWAVLEEVDGPKETWFLRKK